MTAPAPRICVTLIVSQLTGSSEWSFEIPKTERERERERGKRERERGLGEREGG